MTPERPPDGPPRGAESAEPALSFDEEATQQIAALAQFGNFLMDLPSLIPPEERAVLGEDWYQYLQMEYGREAEIPDWDFDVLYCTRRDCQKVIARVDEHGLIHYTALDAQPGCIAVEVEYGGRSVRRHRCSALYLISGFIWSNILCKAIFWRFMAAGVLVKEENPIWRYIWPLFPARFLALDIMPRWSEWERKTADAVVKLGLGRGIIRHHVALRNARALGSSEEAARIAEYFRAYGICDRVICAQPIQAWLEDEATQWRLRSALALDPRRRKRTLPARSLRLPTDARLIARAVNLMNQHEATQHLMTPHGGHS